MGLQVECQLFSRTVWIFLPVTNSDSFFKTRGEFSPFIIFFFKFIKLCFVPLVLRIAESSTLSQCQGAQGWAQGPGGAEGAGEARAPKGPQCGRSQSPRSLERRGHRDPPDGVSGWVSGARSRTAHAPRSAPAALIQAGFSRRPGRD